MKANNISIYLIRLILIGGKFLLSLYLAKVLGLEFLGIFTLLLGAVAVVPMILRGGMATQLSRTVISMRGKDAWDSILSYWVYLSLIYVLLSFSLVFIIGIFFDVSLPVSLFIVIYLEHLVYDIFIFLNGFKKHYFANIILVLQASLWIFPFIGVSWFYPEYRSMEVLLSFWLSAGLLAVFIFLQYLGWEKLFKLKLLGLDWYIKQFFISKYIYVSELIGVLVLYADRYVMYIFLPAEVVGLYGLFWQVANAIANLIGAAIHQTYRPILIAFYNSDMNNYIQSAYSLMKKTISVSLAFTLVSFAGCVGLFYLLAMDAPLRNLELLVLVLVVGNCRVVLDTIKLLLFTQSRDKNKLFIDALFFILSLLAGAGMYWYGIHSYLIIIVMLYGAVFSLLSFNRKLYIFKH